MSDKFDEWLEAHPRIDIIFTEIFVQTIGRQRKLRDWLLTYWELRDWRPGGFFLDHGTIPSVIIEIDDGCIRGVSMVDGSSVVSDYWACGPELTTEKEAWRLANELKEKA